MDFKLFCPITSVRTNKILLHRKLSYLTPCFCCQHYSNEESNAFNTHTSQRKPITYSLLQHRHRSLHFSSHSLKSLAYSDQTTVKDIKSSQKSGLIHLEILVFCRSFTSPSSAVGLKSSVQSKR